MQAWVGLTIDATEHAYDFVGFTGLFGAVRSAVGEDHEVESDCVLGEGTVGGIRKFARVAEPSAPGEKIVSRVAVSFELLGGDTAKACAGSRIEEGFRENEGANRSVASVGRLDGEAFLALGIVVDARQKAQRADGLELEKFLGGGSGLARKRTDVALKVRRFHAEVLAVHDADEFVRFGEMHGAPSGAIRELEEVDDRVYRLAGHEAD